MSCRPTSKRLSAGFGKGKLVRNCTDAATLDQPEKRLDSRHAFRYRLDRIDEDIGVELDLAALEIL